MPITEAEIRQILATDEETGQVEFKIKAPRPGELAERICGLANRRSGGTILFGIENTQRRIVGLTHPHANIDLIWTALRLVKPAVRLLTPEPEVVTWDGKPLVTLQIAPNDGELYQAGGIFWIRKGSQTVPMTKAEIAAHLATYGTLPWEQALCPRATLADLDPGVIDRYHAFRLSRSRHPTRYASSQAMLAGLDCIRPDPSTGEVRPTNAGLLLFGYEPQIQLPHTEVTCIRYADSLGVGKYLDRKNFTGNLMALIDQVAEWLTLHTPVGGEIRGFKRHDLPAYPLEALREAVVNAVVHRDYAQTAEMVRVFYYRDRVEVHSPGLLLPGITIPDLLQLRVPSRPRNPLIAGFLRDIPGYMERAGSGIRLMITEMRQLGLPDLDFVEQHEFVVIFRNGVPPTSADPAGLTPWNTRQLRGLAQVQQVGSISNSEYRALTGASETTALRDLTDLVHHGSLVARGKKRGLRYYLP